MKPYTSRIISVFTAIILLSSCYVGVQAGSADLNPSRPVHPDNIPPTGCLTGNNTYFPDVNNPENPPYEQVYYMACKGYISGYPDGYFHPSWNVSRGEATKIIDKPFRWTYLPSSNPFPDIVGTTFENYIKIAWFKGAVSGRADGLYHPGDPIRRDELAKIASSAARLNENVPSNQQTFDHVPSSNLLWLFVERIADHAADFGAGPCDYNPNKQCFFPSRYATRGDFVQMIFVLSNGNSNGMFVHGDPFFDANNYDYPADNNFHTSDPINGQPTGQMDAMYIGGSTPTYSVEAINMVWNAQEIQWIGDHEQYGSSVRYGPAFALYANQGWNIFTGACAPGNWDTSYPTADTNLPGNFLINTKLAVVVALIALLFLRQTAQ